MVLLVPVHAAMLLALNGDPGGWATAIYWAVHVFRLPLFFAMSGFFLALMLGRKGLQETVRNRTVRIAVPLAVGLVTLVPLMLFAADATGTTFEPGEAAPSGTPFTFEPVFLWFLWYLLIIDCAAIGAFLLFPRLLRAMGNALRAAVGRPVAGIAVLAIPTALALWPAPLWVAAPATDTLIPEPAVLAYNAIFFGLGATLCVHRDLVAAAAANAWRWSACAVAAAIPAGLLFTLHNSASYADRVPVHAAALLIYAVATWCSLLALVGLASRYIKRPRPAVRYLADSSYWIYLSHMPAMVLVVTLLGGLALGTALRLVLVVALSLAASLITYPLFVRYTAIGRILNGPRKRNGPPPWRTLRTALASVTQPAAAATRRA